MFIKEPTIEAAGTLSAKEAGRVSKRQPQTDLSDMSMDGYWDELHEQESVHMLRQQVRRHGRLPMVSIRDL